MAEPTQEQRPRGWLVLKHHLLTHKIDVALWATRLTTIIFTMGYILPIMGDPYNSYYKALMANGATSALRLHQRLPQVQFNRQFLGLFLMEDSAHYLFFTIIFIFTGPITLVLVPVVLFSVLHFASYSLTILDTLGQNSWWGARMLISLVELQSRNILRMVAFQEIFLLPFCVFMIFAGKTSLATPFLYYRFLSMRYSSRRNPYCRTMCHELRLAVEALAYNPKCPVWAKNVIYKAITAVSNLAPAAEAQ
eukprot:TRINITY_DN3279_c0_g1_i1.p1 TRINITY_DN3279_c0_g1~~TRINITY_DN3279_c0_g1_i1.p1  ORF type:complete len:250 (-),score=83.21 TRINITY_DN3279_c0_g1_i1:157-906(-)